MAADVYDWKEFVNATALPPVAAAKSNHTPDEIEAARSFGYKSEICNGEIHFGATAAIIDDDFAREYAFKPDIGPRFGEKSVQLPERRLIYSSSVDDALLVFFEDFYSPQHSLGLDLESIMLHYGPARLDELGGENALLKRVVDKFGQPDRTIPQYKIWDFPSVDRRVVWVSRSGDGVYLMALDPKMSALADNSEQQHKAEQEQKKKSPGF